MLGKDVEIAIRTAMAEAHERRHEFATIEHLCLALLDDEEIEAVLMQAGVKIAGLRKKLARFLTKEIAQVPESTESFETAPSVGFQRVLQRAALHVMGAGKGEVHAIHVFVSLFSEDDSQAVYWLKEAGLSRLDVVSIVSHGLPEHMSGEHHEFHDEEDDDEDGMHRPVQERSSPLELYAVNLTQRAKNGELDQLIGREKELERVIHILLRRRKNNPLLVGEAGVGKTAIAEGLALAIVAGKVPEALKDAEVFALDMGSLVAGTRYRGDFENRLKSVIKALSSMKNAILVIDEIHTVVGAGSTGGGSMDASNLLKPILTEGKIRCLGSTTFRDYRAHFEKDRALARRFQRIDVDEPSEEACVEILRGLKEHYESFHKVRISDEALQSAVQLSARYLHDRHLPDKAIDLVDEAAAGLKLKVVPIDAAPDFKWTVTPKEIEETVAKMAQIPKQEVSVDDRAQLASLENDLRQVVFGQDKAIEQVVTAIKMARAGLREPDKPVGSFLFTGPTGVGKTEVAKQLAKTLGIAFVRFDMSEYMERHTASRLLGAPPGYVGFEQGGLLTDAIHKTPHAVLLLDEVEKAHQDIFNVLLQVMDYGKLTDANGRPTDFRHIIFIMTSNVGAREMAHPRIGFGDMENIGADEAAVKRLFSPEFRNRLDARVAFAQLKPEAMIQIVGKFLKQVKEQLLEKKVQLEVSDEVMAYLASKGFDKMMGARPLSRVIQEEVKKPLAEQLLFGALKDGGVVKLEMKDGRLVVL